MFSEAFVCPQGGLFLMSLPVWPAGSLSGGSLSSGVSVWWGVSVQGLSVQGGLCPGTSSLVW